MPAGEKPKLAYLLRDPNSGSVVVSDLYHLRQSQWAVNAPVTGIPGSSTMGEFDLVLPGPQTDEHWAHRPQYDAILAATNRGIGLKVEGYMGSVGAGVPVVSGVITKMDLAASDSWRLSGMDTLYWLQQSQVIPGEQVVLGNSGGRTAAVFCATQEVLWGDDFANWSGTSSSGHPASTDYSAVSGAWSSTTDALFGESAVSTTGSTAILLRGSTWSDTQFAACMVTATGVCVAGTDTTFAGDVGIYLAADATAANGYLIEFVMKQTSGGSGLYNVDVRILSIAATVFTAVASSANVFTNVPATFPFELTAIRCPAATGAGLTTTTPTLRVILNGKDPSCSAAISAGSGGRIGLSFRYTAGGSPTAYFNRLHFNSRTNQTAGWTGSSWGTDRFQSSITGAAHPTNPGSVVVGQGQTHLDMIMSSAAFDGAQVRKTPGAGAKADTITYSAAGLGTDLSSSLTFEEGVNVEPSGTRLVNVAEIYSSDARVNAVPTAGSGSDSGGSITWRRVGAPGDMVLVDTVSDVGMVGFSLLRRYAALIQARKMAPLVAVEVTVARDEKLLRWNNGWGPVELDYVTVHLPTLGIVRQKVQIVGYKIDETSGFASYTLTQFPESSSGRAEFQRFVRALDFLTTTYAAR
jgi:hypothetical protein